MAMVGALFKALAASQVDGEVNKLTFRLWSMFNLREITTYLLSPKEYVIIGIFRRCNRRGKN
jgi:hypothetical protein